MGPSFEAVAASGPPGAVDWDHAVLVGGKGLAEVAASGVGDARAQAAVDPLPGFWYSKEELESRAKKVVAHNQKVIENHKAVIKPQMKQKPSSKAKQR